LRATARTVKQGRTLSFYECDIADESGRLMARVSATMMTLDEDQRSGGDVLSRCPSDLFQPGLPRLQSVASTSEKRVSREHLEPFFRLHREANLNMIRNWVGESTEETFYQLPTSTA
jgi:hypothetical protein